MRVISCSICLEETVEDDFPDDFACGHGGIDSAYPACWPCILKSCGDGSAWPREDIVRALEQGTEHREARCPCCRAPIVLKEHVRALFWQLVGQFQDL